MAIPTPHLDDICAGARDAPVTGVPWVQSVWIGGTATKLPEDWAAFDPDGQTGVAIVRAAWRRFWTRPFRAYENSGGRHLLFWHAGLLQLTHAPDAPTGLRMYRQNSLGSKCPRIEMALSPGELCAGMLGTRARSLLEAGILRCIRLQLRRRGLPLHVPRAFVDALGFRIETQMDARMDWPRACAELHALAVGGEHVVQLLEAVAPESNRVRLWQRAALAARFAAADWPVSERAFLPFLVPMRQHDIAAVSPAATPAATPADVAVWLHGIGVSRMSISRLHRLPFEVAARIASVMLDVTQNALCMIAGALNRFLAVIAATADHEAKFPDLMRATCWLAMDAAYGIRHLPAVSDRMLTAGVLRERSDELPWPPTGRREYAIERGFWTAETMDLRPGFIVRPGAMHEQLQLEPPRFGDDIDVHVGIPPRGHCSVISLTERRVSGDDKSVRHFAARITARYLEGCYLAPEDAHPLTETLDWFYGAQPVPGIAQLRGDWATIQHRQLRWHTAQARARAQGTAKFEPGDPVRWEEWITPQEESPYRAIQIANEIDLWHEGEVLQHCVYGYGAQCISGESVIFSIRLIDGDHRFGTAQFRRDKDGWALTQFRGLRNRVLPDDSTEAPAALQRLIARLKAGLELIDGQQAQRTAQG